MNFSIKEAFNLGYRKTLANFWFLAGIVLVSSLLVGLPQIIYQIIYGEEHMNFGVSLITFILGLLIGLGQIKIALTLTDDSRATWADLFNNYLLVPYYFIASLLVAILMGIGLILFIIPGLYIGIRLIFFPYFLVDKKVGPIESIKQSMAVTKSEVWNLLGLALSSIILLALGLLAFGIGLIFVLPIIMIAWAQTYRSLERKLEPVPAVDHTPMTKIDNV
jgi:uncharacterized membrane protein